MSGQPEVVPDAGERVEEGVDLGRGRIEEPAGPRARPDAEAPVDRLRAVVTDADGDTGGVEHLPDVVRVHTIDDDADGTDAVIGGRRAQDADARDPGDAGEHPLGERVLVGGYPVHAD